MYLYVYSYVRFIKKKTEPAPIRLLQALGLGSKSALFRPASLPAIDVMDNELSFHNKFVCFLYISVGGFPIYIYCIVRSNKRWISKDHLDYFVVEP